MMGVASSPARRSPWRSGLAALAGAVALLAGSAAALGVFARGDGSFVTVMTHAQSTEPNLRPHAG
jgi:hypothetical protein